MVETTLPVSTRVPFVGMRVAVPLATWSFLYAGYRAYYAAGGQVGMIGTPVSGAQFRAINAVGALIILAAGILPLAALRSARLRRALPVVAWVAAVGCCMHALVDSSLRIFSLTGVHPTALPASVWSSFDRHAADLQDLLVNEPWFLVEGLLWASLGIGLVRAPGRRAWVLSASVACLLLTIVGVLSGLGVIGTIHLG